MPDLIQRATHNFSATEMLFGDLPISYWGTVDSEEVPWTLFKKVKKSIDNNDNDTAIDILEEITYTPGFESRQYLQAYHFLKELQESSTGTTIILGVVLEVNMAEGNDTLAVYADYTSRYYNYSGKSIIWEHPDDSLDTLIDGIFTESNNIVSHIGPWKDARPEPPTNKMVRINFLTSNGLHFREASPQALFNDPRAGKLMHGMLNLMNALIDKSMNTGAAA